MNKDYDLVIEPGKGIRQYWRDIWNYRELFYFLAWRDILVRYKQTIIGIAWSVIRPFLTMIVLTIIFGSLAKLPSDAGAPYAILVFSALLPWQMFANALSESSSSLVGNSNLISKVYFPRLIIPASSIIVSIIDFLTSFVILFLLMLWYQYIPSIRILMLPLFLAIALIVAFGFGVWLSTLNVKYRDFRYIVPFIMQFGLYISPVGFSSNVVPEKWRMLYSINPMVGVIDGFRWAIIGGDLQLYIPGFLISIILSLLVLYSGLMYFRKSERSFADLI